MLRTRSRVLLSPLRDCRGVTALEYGLIAGLIALVMIGSVTLLGSGVSGMFTAAATQLQAVAVR
jgi:pilus assembly protein Flp/PilA